jgi:hypothetical protein
MGSSDVTSVQVTCMALTHSLGGSISGLTTSGLILANGTDTVSPASGATQFVFSQQVAEGAAFAVTVQHLPSGANCSVTGGSGTMGTGNINSVQVICSAAQPAAVWRSGDVGPGNYPFVARDPSSAALFLAWSATDTTQPIQASRFTDATGWSTPVSIAPHGVVNGMGFDLQGKGFATFNFDQNTVGFSRYTPSAGWTSGGPVIPLPPGPPEVIPPGDTLYTRSQPSGLAVFGDGSADSLVYSQIELSGSSGAPTYDDTYIHLIGLPGGDALQMDAVDTTIPPSSAVGVAEHIVAPNGVLQPTQYYTPVSIDTPVYPMTQAPSTKFHAVLFEEIDQTLDPATDYTMTPTFTVTSLNGVVLWDGTTSFFHYLVGSPVTTTHITKNGMALSDNGSALFAWSVLQANGSATVFAQRYDGSAWGAVQTLYNDPTPGSDPAPPSIPVSAINASGDGIIFFAVLNGTMAVKVDGKSGSFGPPVLLSTDSSPYTEGICLIGLLDDQGNAYLMDEPGARYDLSGALRIRRLAAGAATWASDGVTAAFDGPYEGFYVMTLDRDGFPMAAWQNGAEIYTARYH